jgi:gliding motility-associated-like protein
LKQYFTIFILFIGCLLTAQNNLSPIVIGSQGKTATSTGGNSVEYTVGEAVILTSTGANGNIITQGFHQPLSILSNNLLSVYCTIEDASCFGLYDGSIIIDSITGCDGNYTILLDGVLQNIFEFDTLKSENYILDITSSDGCSLSENITLGIEGTDCDISFYNAFSPNEDGVNEYWHIEKVEAYPDNTVQIFDRWGVLIWKTSGYNNSDNRWEGLSSRGKEMLNGTYFYIFQSEDFVNKGYIEITK